MLQIAAKCSLRAWRVRAPPGSVMYVPAGFAMHDKSLQVVLGWRTAFIVSSDSGIVMDQLMHWHEASLEKGSVAMKMWDMVKGSVEKAVGPIMKSEGQSKMVKGVLVSRDSAGTGEQVQAAEDARRIEEQEQNEQDAQRIEQTQREEEARRIEQEKTEPEAPRIEQEQITNPDLQAVEEKGDEGN